MQPSTCPSRFPLGFVSTANLSIPTASKYHNSRTRKTWPKD
jgi:hypothetical protein